MRSSSIGVALVTHDSEGVLAKTLESIEHQSMPVTHIRVVDDASTDSTIDILTRWCHDMRSRGVDATFVAATSTDSNTITRTAQNFTQAVRALEGCDLVALADHDDVWLPHRIDTQVSFMDQHPHALMLASNGSITDDDGPRTLFEAFAVPSDLNTRTCVNVARFVIRQSVVTGSASIVRPGQLTALPNFTPPQGWLHDRWWSILAASRCGLCIDETPVIDYRVTSTQQVGLDRGRQSRHGLSRVAASRWSDFAKFRDLMSIRPFASADARAAFGAAALTSALSRRAYG